MIDQTQLDIKTLEGFVEMAESDFREFNTEDLLF